MKRTGIVVMTLLLLSFFICGCTMDKHDDSVKQFFSELNDKVTGINYISFDGQMFSYTDPETIEEIMSVLQSADFVEIKEENYVEGMYHFELLTSDEVYNLGIENYHIGFKGKQYRIDGNLSGNLSDTIFESLGIVLDD